MKFRFTGQYTNGRTGISILGYHFEGREPTEVSEAVAKRLARHPEFEACAGVKLIEYDPTQMKVHITKRRGRKPKAAD